MSNANLQTNWEDGKITVTSTLLPKILWQTASIDVFLNEKCLLKTNGQLKITGSHTAQFTHNTVNHEVILIWGTGGLRTFPIEVSIDGKQIIKSEIYTSNWILGCLPWLALIIFTIYSWLK